MHHHSVGHACSRGLLAEPGRFHALAGDQQLQSRTRAREREEREQEILMPAVGAVAGRCGDHPADRRIEHRRKDGGGTAVLVDVEDAAEHAGGGRGRAGSEQRLAHRCAAAERTRGQTRRTRGERAEIGAGDLQQNGNVEQLRHQRRSEVALAGMHDGRAQAIELRRQLHDAVAGHSFQPVSVLAQRLRDAAVHRTHERDLPDQVPHLASHDERLHVTAAAFGVAPEFFA